MVEMSRMLERVHVGFLRVVARVIEEVVTHTLGAYIDKRQAKLG